MALPSDRLNCLKMMLMISVQAVFSMSNLVTCFTTLRQLRHFFWFVGNCL